MLTREWMGVLALGILWVNTLLVAGAALQRVARLTRLMRELRGAVRRGPAPSATFAAVTVEQVGRYGAGSKRHILWHDKAYGSEIGGGEIALSGGGSLVVPSTSSAMVWLDQARVKSAADERTEKTFDDAYAGARKAKGFGRKITVSVDLGDEVYVAKLPGEAGDTWLVASMDPLGWCRGRALVITVAFVPSVLLVAAGITLLALWPPAFGTVSIIGALLGVLYFLLVLPAGTAVRDWARLPHERIIRGAWADPAGRATPDANEARAGKAAAGAALLVAGVLVEDANADPGAYVPSPYEGAPSGPYAGPGASAPAMSSPAPRPRSRFRGAIGGAVGAFVAPETRFKYYQFISLLEAQAGWQFNDLVSMYAMGRLGFGGGEEADAYVGISWMSELTFEDRILLGFGFDALLVQNLDDTDNRSGLSPGARFRVGGYPALFGRRTSSAAPNTRRRGLAVGAELGFHPFPNQLMLAPTAFVSYEAF